MCGIVGTLEPRSNRRALLIRAMNAQLVHRGPDSDGLHEDDDAALAMRRLAIIDVAHGTQPVYSEDGCVVAVFNGEIYNFRELQSHLRSRGHRLNSESDTECIPHLYEEYGADFARHLRGMFAITLWDIGRQRLVLARDRLGKKPLFYRPQHDTVAFASEMRALLVDGRTARSLDAQALSHYLTFQYVPAPHSIYESVRKVRPGHVVVWEPGSMQERPYWSAAFRPDGAQSERPVDDLAEEFRTHLLDAVAARLVSERPVGAFLSGGLDSSAIVAAMSRVSTSPVRTFSIGFQDESYNELPFARQVAERYSTEHHEFVVKGDALAVLPTLARAFGEPFADSSAIPSYYLSKMTRNSVVVALNGDGGDELFGGYLRYLEFLHPGSTADHRLRRRARSLAGRLLHGRPAQSAPPDRDFERYGRLISYFDPESKARVLGPAVRTATADPSISLLGDLWNARNDLDEVNRMLAVDTETYLPGDLLPKVDITTMHVSLEARSPLLDHHLVEWAASLRGDVKVRNGQTKWLMKRALEPWLPADLIHRRKQGFGVPLGTWLRGPLRPMLKELLPSGRAVDRGWLDPVEVRRILRLHRSGVDVASRLYALLMLELWIREVDEAPAEVAV